MKFRERIIRNLKSKVILLIKVSIPVIEQHTQKQLGEEM